MAEAGIQKDGASRPDPIKAPHARCHECPLKHNPFVPPAGKALPDIIIIGEAPGREEVREGRPFVGKSGWLLAEFLREAGRTDEQLHLTNAVLCRPDKNEKPTSAAIQCCRPRLLAEVAGLHTARRVALMGNVAVEATLGSLGGMVTIRGSWYDWQGKLALPTWHPAYVLRNPEDAAELIKDLQKLIRGTKLEVITTSIQPEKVVISTPSQLYQDLGQWENEWIAFDFESNQNSWVTNAALLLAIAKDRDRGYIITDELLYDSPDAIRILNDVWKRNKWIGHNAKYDLHFASKLGIQAHADFDTMLAHYVLDERKGGHGLKKLAREYYDVRDYDHEFVHRYLRSREDDWSKVPFDQLSTYAVFDVVLTLALKDDLERELREQGLYEWPFLNLMMPLSDLAFHMEELGMQVDLEALAHWQEVLDKETTYWRGRTQEISGHPFLNPNSPAQLAPIIWDERKLPPAPASAMWDKVRGQVLVNPRSTGVNALNHLATLRGGEIVGYEDEFLHALWMFRRVRKIKSTYIDNILAGADDHGRYHDDIKIFGTETGRFATFLHTIPRETTDIYGRMVRSSFTAAPGHKFVSADFSQAELRAAGAVSGEPFILEVYRQGRDLHSEVCESVFGPGWGKEQRIIIKRYNFAYLYGGGYSALVSDSNIPKDKAGEIMSKYDATMTVLAQWKRNSIRFLLENGYIQTPFGRRRRFPYINDVNRKEAEKAAINVPVQSTAADITNLAAYALMKEGHRVVLTKHDEVLAEVPEDGAAKHAEHIREIMEATAAKHFPEVTWKAEYEMHDRWTEPPERS